MVEVMLVKPLGIPGWLHSVKRHVFMLQVNASLIPAKQKGILLEALWDGKLRNEERFNETEFVGPWFQKRLRPFLSAISANILQCLHNKTMRCAQYQAMYVSGFHLVEALTSLIFPLGEFRVECAGDRGWMHVVLQGPDLTSVLHCQ